VLTRAGERLAARRQYAEAWSRAEKRFGELRRRSEHMLAIVEQNEQRSVHEPATQRVDCRRISAYLDAERTGHGARHEVGIMQCGKLNEPDAVGKPHGSVPGRLQGKPCLSDPTGTGQRDKARTGKQSSDFAKLFASADQTRRPLRRVAGPHGRKIARRLIGARWWCAHFVAPRRGHEAIAAAGLCYDPVFAERTAQRVHVNVSTLSSTAPLPQTRATRSSLVRTVPAFSTRASNRRKSVEVRRTGAPSMDSCRPAGSSVNRPKQ